ncbi:hypothetical protein [Mycobacterium canetti]|nr:hypothetical protein [Mycobacterium canetti]
MTINYQFGDVDAHGAMIRLVNFQLPRSGQYSVAADTLQEIQA